jgi:hypothetical protein
MGRATDAACQVMTMQSEHERRTAQTTNAESRTDAAQVMKDRARAAEDTDTPGSTWKASLMAVGITALLLVTFVVLFAAATGSAPQWWPW